MSADASRTTPPNPTNVGASAQTLAKGEGHAILLRALQQLNQVVVGKSDVVTLVVGALLAGGHVLLEDLPGVGKTTLAHAVAATFGLQFQRVQFTSDLLPSDLVGISIYRREHERFEFVPGPIFAQLLLADELNRGSPKTQSALLEAMAEAQVTADGQTRVLPEPFFVLATQNPLEQIGTFALPESQLDRFMVTLQLGYPDSQAERALLLGEDRKVLIARLQAQVSEAQLLALRREVEAVKTSSALLDYLQKLLKASREHPAVRFGLSPRAGLALLRMARALALLAGRDYVIPEDVQQAFVPLTAHRLSLQDTQSGARTVAQGILQQVPVV
jgi:MoxR-like ATPase